MQADDKRLLVPGTAIATAAAKITQRFVSPHIKLLPEAFGRPRLADGLDRKLFDFFIFGLCGGRTVIPSSNLYLQQFAPMVREDEGVKHAVLSVAASYVPDFQRDDRLVARANLHQRCAINLLGRPLNTPEIYTPGKEDAVIATILLLEHNEAVNIGAEASSNLWPPWWNATKAAEDLLTVSDLGYGFHDPYNVQCS